MRKKDPPSEEMMRLLAGQLFESNWYQHLSI